MNENVQNRSKSFQIKTSRVRLNDILYHGSKFPQKFKMFPRDQNVTEMSRSKNFLVELPYKIIFYIILLLIICFSRAQDKSFITMTIAVHWFRNGLRLHDNPALLEAINQAEKLITLYIIDENRCSKYNNTQIYIIQTVQYLIYYYVNN